jgi:hypothetical protein
MNDDLVLTDRPDRRAPGFFGSWMKGQVTIGNLVVIIVFVFGLGSFQTRAEMTATAAETRLTALEDRLRAGEFMRAEVAEERFRSVQTSLSDLKDSIDKGFARIERAVR